jgi:hypothetical protein
VAVVSWSHVVMVPVHVVVPEDQKQPCWGVVQAATVVS